MNLPKPRRSEVRDGFAFTQRADKRWSVEDAASGAHLGTVWNNGARTTYGRHWTARTPDGHEVGKSSSRRSAAEHLRGVAATQRAADLAASMARHPAGKGKVQ